MGRYLFDIHYIIYVTPTTKGIEMRDIIIEFSGWVRMTAKNTKFVCIHDADKPDIDGEHWLALDHEQRGDYILEDVIATQRDCDDGDYTFIDVFEDDSP